MSYLQGDIVIVKFPFSDLSRSKLRPAVIISNNKSNTESFGDYILAQITTTIRNDNYSVSLENSDVTSPIKITSEIRANKIFTADDAIIEKKISSLVKSKRTELFEKITEVINVR